MTVLHVDAAGSDANNGVTWGTAKLTLAAAVTALPASGGGVLFTGNLGPATIAKANIALAGSGMTAAIQQFANATAVDISNVANMDLRDFRIVGTGNPASTLQRGVQAINVSRSRITGLRVYDLGYDGILLLSGCSDCIIEGCLVVNPGDDGINIGGDPVAPTVRTIVQGNHVVDAGVTGIHLSDGSSGTIVKGNIVSGSGGYGIDTRPGVDGNIISGNICDGIEINSDHNLIFGNYATVIVINGDDNVVVDNRATVIDNGVGNTIRGPISRP